MNETASTLGELQDYTVASLSNHLPGFWSFVVDFYPAPMSPGVSGLHQDLPGAGTSDACAGRRVGQAAFRTRSIVPITTTSPCYPEAPWNSQRLLLGVWLGLGTLWRPSAICG